MEAAFLHDLIWGLSMALAGGVVFSAISLVSGTDETSTMAPLTLLIILLGVPPVGVFSWFMAATMSKHMIHSIPTALMGIPGDSLAVPMLQYATTLRQLGAPHVCLRKMISGGILGAFIALPIAVFFASMLSPLADFVKAWAPVIFAVGALIVAYTSRGKWASLFVLVFFAFILQAINKTASAAVGHGLFISFFLGIAVGPLFADIMTILSPLSRHTLQRDKPREFWLAPELKMWEGYFPNPWKILTKRQRAYVLSTAAFSSLTFTFSPIGMTVMVGEFIYPRVKSLYQKLTTTLSAMNGVTEATYIAEAIIPLVAFGIPLSPVAMGPAAPLFNAPPVYNSNPGTMHNLHTLLQTSDFLLYGFVGILVAALLAYPFSMNYARRASLWVLRAVSQEAIIAMFTGIIFVISYYEAGIIGVLVATTLAIFGGVMNKFFGIHTGVQFMAYYASPWLMLKLFGI